MYYSMKQIKIINKLPKRFQWTLHNIVAHPLMELAYQLGLEELSVKIHDSTMPTDSEVQDNIDSIMNPERND